VTKAVFYHKPDSGYDDLPKRFYHFPKQYLSRVEQTIGDYIVYYGPHEQSDRYYSSTAKVIGVRPDTNLKDHFYADVRDFLDFDRLVPYKENGGFEKDLVRPDGSINGGRAVQAVRIIEDAEFAAIIEAGLSNSDEWPDPDEAIGIGEPLPGLAEEINSGFERPIIQQLSRRPFRDRKFRQHVKLAYDRACAFTGLRLINGHGRPEVQAAHIMPVEANGPDSVRNGIALSGTVHWMFDRGLLSIEDDYTIMISRHLNYDISHLLVADLKARVPENPNLRPHPHYLNWHRENRFKF